MPYIRINYFQSVDLEFHVEAIILLDTSMDLIYGYTENYQFQLCHERVH